MKRYLIQLGFIFTFITVLCIYAAIAEEQSADMAVDEMSDSGTGDSAVCSAEGCADSQDGETMVKEQADRLHKMGVSEDRIRQLQVLSNAKIRMDSPAIILSQSDALKLTDDQKQTLHQIEVEARQKAMAVLTANQKGKLVGPIGRSVTMQQIHQTVCEKMMQHHQMKEGGKGAGPMMCAMCPMMHRQEGSKKDGGVQTTQPTGNQYKH